MRPFGVTPRCLISEPSVIDTAKASGRTRAIEAAHQAAERGLLEGALTHNGLGSPPEHLQTEKPSKLMAFSDLL